MSFLNYIILCWVTFWAMARAIHRLYFLLFPFFDFTFHCCFGVLSWHALLAIVELNLR
jgi:hypothetical protein